MKFNEADFEVKKESTKGDVKGLYWALGFFIAYFAVDGYASALLGAILPCVIFPLLFTWIKLNTWHVWNVFFVFALAMCACAIFALELGTRSPEILFRSTFPEAIFIIAFVYVLVLVVALLMLSPFSFKHLFSAVWIKDIYQTDMKLWTEKVEQVDRFAGYNLTPRQREVAVLILAAKTGRQISSELGISESTARMHISELYKKLGINSRAELFRIFGVTAESETLDK